MRLQWADIPRLYCCPPRRMFDISSWMMLQSSRLRAHGTVRTQCG